VGAAHTGGKRFGAGITVRSDGQRQCRAHRWAREARRRQRLATVPAALAPSGLATGIAAAQRRAAVVQAAQGEVTLWHIEGRGNGSRRQADRWPSRWCEYSACGRLDDGNSAGDDRRAEAEEGDGFGRVTGTISGLVL
jgi:hypothetical protein